MPGNIIITERLKLRKWIDADIIPFTAMNKDPDVMQYFPSVLADEETIAMINRIDLHFKKYGFGLFAVENLSTKEFIGYTGFMIPSFVSFFTPCIEIGWRLQKKHWGFGYATEAAKACLEHGFKTLSFDVVYSFTSKLNIKSEKVMQRIRMIKEGEFNHPKIDLNDKLCRHVLYKIEKPTNT
jgi:RimJ/RimL family protein N-acetyltransferase